MSRQPEGFAVLARRAVARGESRVLPIAVGGKNPLMKWKDSDLDVLPEAEWLKIVDTFINAAAKMFPDANCCVIAKPNEKCLIDEDSDDFRTGFEAWSGIPFPRTFTTSARAGHRQSHWSQTDATRKLGNVGQDQTPDGVLSFRQHNLYVLSEGSQYKDGENYYDVVDDSPIAPMPDKLVKYIEHLVSLEDAKKVKPESASTSTVDLDSPFIHHQIHPRLVTLAGYYVQNKNISDADELYTLLIARIEKNGCFYEDGITSFPYDNKKVRQVAESAVQSWKTGEQKKLESQLTLNQQPATATPVDVSDWRDQFRSVGEMEDGPIDMIIEGALQEGTCFIGANPGDGKTLVGLAFAKAISTGEPLFGIPQFCVKQPRTVIYLIPESRDRAFRKRCEAFRIPNDKMKFMARTISAGVSLELSDPRLLKAVNQTKAVVFLDTASRFMKGSDENAAAQNRQLVNDVIALLAAGAVCVVLVHHATKAAKANQERMTLENMLRGTSDFGAMCDQAYGIRKDMNLYSNGSGPMEIDLVSLKDREQIGGLTSIRLAASYKVKYTEKGRSEVTFPVSCINETGNFSVVSDSETSRREVQALEAMVKEDPNIPAKDIAERVGITEYRVKNQLTRLGWHRVQGGLGGASPWHKDAGGSCPYDKVVEVKPSKKTLDTTVTEVVGNLRDLLKDTSPTGDYVPETEVLSWADKRGITETVLNKAKRRLGVVVNKDGDIKTWALPVTPEGVEAA